jgi:beta-galactosidase GanA
MTSQLDVAQFNHYNNPQNLWETCFWTNYLRPLKNRPFWNTETATCWNGSTAANGYREAGFCRANSWIPIALGGEANLYWLWRAHWSGHELMHGSVVSSAGRPLHIIDEVHEVAAGFNAAREFINGTSPVTDHVGLHFSELAWWTFEFQPMVNGFNYNRSMIEAAYKPLHEAHIAVDVIDPAAPLEKYKVVFSPFLPALDESGLRSRLRNWIEKGGIWIAGPLTDIRTVDATKFTHSPFGTLEEWAGVYTKYEIPADPHEFTFRWNDGRESTGSSWYSAFEPRGAEVLATYGDGPMEGLAAVTRNKLGKGEVITLGTMPPMDDIKRLLWNVGIAPFAGATSNLLVVRRSGAVGSGLIAVELENRPAMLTLDTPMTNLLNGQRYTGVVDLEPYAVMVLQQDVSQ